MCALDQAEHDLAAPGAACDQTGRMVVDPQVATGPASPQCVQHPTAEVRSTAKISCSGPAKALPSW